MLRRYQSLQPQDARAWNVVASDETLWRTQFLSLFGTSNRRLSLMNAAGVREGVRKPDQDKNNGQALRKPAENAGGAWRKAFNLALKGFGDTSLGFRKRHGGLVSRGPYR